jgi:teichuronic acid biosynthesis protein TuaE
MEDVLFVTQPKRRMNKKESKQLIIWLFLVCLFGLSAILVSNTRMIQAAWGGFAGFFGLWCFAGNDLPLRKIERTVFFLMVISGFLGATFLPISVGPVTLFSFRLLFALLWILFCVHVFVDRGKVEIPKKVKWYLLFFGLWLVYGVLSVAWSQAKIDAFRQLVFLFIGISIVFFALQYVRTQRDLAIFFFVWLAVFIFFSVHGLYEHVSGLHLPTSKLFGDPRSWVRYTPTGFFHNQNDFATFLALGLPFAFSLFRYAKRNYLKALTMGSVLLALYLIVLTGSRANLLAITVGTGFILVCLTNIRGKIKAVIALVFLGLIVLQTSDVAQQMLFRAVEQVSSLFATASERDNSISVRTNMIKNGIVFVLSTFGFGVGAGNAEHWIASHAVFSTGHILNLHNWWLEILVNYGVLVFTAYVVMCLSLIKRIWQIWRASRRRRDKMISEALLVSLVIFFFASISSSNIMAFKTQWYLFAFAIAFLNLYRKGVARL